MGLWQSSTAAQGSISTKLHEFECPESHEESSHALDVDLAGARGWVWYRYRPTWIEAKPLGDPPLDLPIHLVLVHDGDMYLALYPVSSDSATCHLSAAEGRWTACVRRSTGGAGRGAVVEARSRRARDTTLLVRAAIHRARVWAGADRVASPLGADNPLHGLGFCTWSALGESSHVTRAQFAALLSDLAAARIPVQAFVIDDGWQDQRDRRLWSFGSNAAFGDLGEAVALVRDTFARVPGAGRCDVGVWLALNGGYWGGVHAASPLVREYTCEPAAYAGPDGGGTYWLPTSGAFWADWFGALKARGVSFVKVDNQASLAFLAGAAGQARAARVWADMLAAADAAFGPQRVVHSMAHSAGTFNGRAGFARAALVWRNSDDFGCIHGLRNAHQAFVFANVSNALVANQLATLPDADMFMTAAQHPAAHAVLRAMFPGPVLLSDRPGEHDARLLGRLVARDAAGRVRVVKCAAAAELLPRRALDTGVLDDSDGSAAWAAVPCGRGALLAAFNCRDAGRRVRDRLTLADVHDAMAVAGMRGPAVVLRYDLERGALTAASLAAAAEPGTAAEDGAAAALQDVHLDEMGVALWRIASVHQLWGLTGQFAGLNAVSSGRYMYAGTAAARGDSPLPRLDGGESEIGIRTFEVKPGDKA